MSIKAVFGTITIPLIFDTDEKIAEIFEILKKEGVTTLDTARLYVGAEEAVGRVPGHEDFIIDTKLQGGVIPGTVTKEGVVKDTQDSLDRCQVKQFDILYLHAPDSTVPIGKTLEGINEVYKKGQFRRLGLSNFTGPEVQEVYDVAKSKGYVLPTVYQGNYNPIARHLDTLLFPTLRKLGIAFYAYSPLAGGFLTKTKEQIDSGVSRFNDQAAGGLYVKLYNRPLLREALGEWNNIAEKEGVSRAELAYRWVGYHSSLKAELGDAVIFGASSHAQIEQTAQWLKKGKLSATAAEDIEKIWESVKAEAPVDNFHI
ncbi:aflatoxin B1 aldehyde reductase-like protein member 2 [Lophiostoma macrostomum CBS 122681]|uniref:Aflatoxin B1 aldehyde reductase-like protein member 2 n=1 Tax=Lophiostoma macrostomum CBS 122681 TaxID=1314788 RepID=A0A6A6SLJ1_9PLEO|nr:aflatoxin B1 aldehyde reductase-like protein member 2 [Lophiostoma macrostomum CBS 122681]